MGATFKQLRWVALTANITTSSGTVTITLPYTPSISADNIPIICLSATTYQGMVSTTAGSKTATVQIWQNSSPTVYSGYIRFGTLLPCSD